MLTSKIFNKNVRNWLFESPTLWSIPSIGEGSHSWYIVNKSGNWAQWCTLATVARYVVCQYYCVMKLPGVMVCTTINYTINNIFMRLWILLIGNTVWIPLTPGPGDWWTAITASSAHCDQCDHPWSLVIQPPTLISTCKHSHVHTFLFISTSVTTNKGLNIITNVGIYQF